MKNSGTIFICIAIVYTVWSGTFLAMRIALPVMPPFFMAGSRFAVAGILMFIVLLIRGAPWPTARQWMLSTAAGALLFAFGNGLVAYAEGSISSGIAALVFGTMPLWVAALGPLFGSQASRREWTALVLGFLGLMALSLNAELHADPWRATVLLFAPLSWALGTLLVRRMDLPKGAMSSATQMTGGGCVLLLMSIFFGEVWPLHVLPMGPTLAWLYLVIGGSFLGYTAYTYLLRNARPSLATSYAYVNPVIAVFAGSWIGGEHVDSKIFVALACIVSATVMLMWKRT